MTATKLNGLEGYVTLKEGARTLGLSYWQVRRLVEQSDLPAVRVGYTLMVRMQDLLRARRQQGVTA